MKNGENDKLDFLTMYCEFGKEQESVRNYVMNRPMNRPKTNIMTILFLLGAFLFFCIFVSFLTAFVFHNTNVYVHICIWVAALIMMLRLFLIKAVECYQHYAKNSTRKKCLCKPTCSEYAIAVLHKYCIFVAIYKIWKRLFVICKDGMYKIDLP